MAFIGVPMARGAEQTVAPEGEYALVVRKAELKTTKKGDPMVVLQIGFEGEPDYLSFSHFITFPKAGDKDDFVSMKVREIRRLCHVFHVDYTDEGFDTDDFSGATGTCRVTVETYEPEGKAPRDNNRLVLPRVVE